MKKNFLGFLLLFVSGSLFFVACKKENALSTTNSSLSASLHNYGVNTAVTPDVYANVPVYSYVYAPSAATAAVPAVYTLATPAVRNQGQIGSCTGFCGAETNEILHYYKNGSWPAILSPAFVYYIERVKILHQSISVDNGANMVNIPQALQGYGDCFESSYLYPSSNTSTAYKTAPTASALTQGLSYEIGQSVSSYSLISTGDTASVKQNLRNNKPVMMGFNVYDNTRTYQYFEALNTSSYTYNPLTTSGALVSGVSLLGGHAVPIIGYDDVKKAFLIENSWGTSWGNAGFFYMPYSVFMSTKIVPAGNCYVASL